MSVAVVTGYVPLPCDHRSADDYAALGSQLLALCGKSLAFRQPLADCWMANWMADAGMAVEPGGKDTAAYHAVQHEKSRWIARAAGAMAGVAPVFWVVGSVVGWGSHMAWRLRPVEQKSAPH